MYGLRLAIVVLAGSFAALGTAQSAEAQFYGSIGYGFGGYPYYGGHQYSGYYANTYGAYPYTGIYVGSGYIPPAYGYNYTRNYYGIGSLGYGRGYGLAGPVVVAPNPIYGTTTTIIRGGPTGGVIQYTNNGNGYTYVPDSTYPTVIQQQPTLGLSRTNVIPSPPPVVVESRPQGSTYGLSNNTTAASIYPNTPSRSAGIIKLVCPKTAGGPLSYSLNGHVYTIQPGYAQTFRDDRPWKLEFKRAGDESEVASYSLKAGTYSFVAGASGWELQQGSPSTTSSDLPPAPLPDVSPSPSSSLPPSPLPPP